MMVAYALMFIGLLVLWIKTLVEIFKDHDEEDNDAP